MKPHAQQRISHAAALLDTAADMIADTGLAYKDFWQETESGEIQYCALGAIRKAAHPDPESEPVWPATAAAAYTLAIEELSSHIAPDPHDPSEAIIDWSDNSMADNVIWRLRRTAADLREEAREASSEPEPTAAQDS